MTPKQIEESKKFARAVAVPWRENMPFSKMVMIDHESFHAWQEELYPQIGEMRAGKMSDPQTTLIPVGDDKVFFVNIMPFVWLKPHPSVAHIPSFLLTEEDYRLQRSTLKNYAGNTKVGLVSFTDDVKIPSLAARDGSVMWMSLTPQEVWSQRAGVRISRGKVLMGGMGMGWLARRVLERKKVESLTVVDLDADVLEYFGSPLKREFGDRLTLVHDDVYRHAAARYDTVLMDIWPNVNDMPRDEKFKELKACHPNVWGWGYDVKFGL